jgi:hypothetical protein
VEHALQHSPIESTRFDETAPSGAEKALTKSPPFQGVLRKRNQKAALVSVPGKLEPQIEHVHAPVDPVDGLASGDVCFTFLQQQLDQSSQHLLHHDFVCSSICSCMTVRVSKQNRPHRMF